MLASLLYPYDDDARTLMDGWLDELEQQGHIRLYGVDGTHYLEICKWLEHQKIDRPSTSRLPEYREPSPEPREPSRALDTDLGPRTSTKDQGPSMGAVADATRPPTKLEIEKWFEDFWSAYPANSARPQHHRIARTHGQGANAMGHGWYRPETKAVDAHRAARPTLTAHRPRWRLDLRFRMASRLRLHRCRMMHGTLSRAGRKRSRTTIRDAAGKSRGEAVQTIVAVALRQRLREGVSGHDVFIRDERGIVVGVNQDSGHLLGRMRIRGEQDPGGISDRQYHAGMSYAQLVCRHASIMGYSLGSAKSPSFMLVSAGQSTASEPDERTILHIRQQFNDCYRVLMDLGLLHGVATRIATNTYDACLDRITFAEVQADDVLRGNIKIGLNELGRILR
jgi:hypothetical protein